MQSIWSRTAALPRFETLQGDTSVDVLIIGGGMAGLLCAHHLTKAGVDCLLVEAERIGCGITKNTTAKITSQHGLVYADMIRRQGAEAARIYLQANEAALAEYRTLCRDIDCDFEEKDAYVYLLSDRQKIEREVEALQKIGYPAEFAEQLPLPFRTAGAVRFPAQAQFHPLKFAAGISQGLRICEHTKVRELVGTTAVTSGGRIRAQKIIVATHFPFLNKHGFYFVKMYQDRSYVLALENAAQFDGMYIDGSGKGLSLRQSGEVLLVGSGAHRTGKKGTDWQDAERFAELYYPGAREICRWATQDCITLDGMPYIGRYAKNTPDLYVATGFNKWGMTSSMVAARQLTDMIMGKENAARALFDPSRSVLRPQLAANLGAAVLGLITPQTKRCPHLGCALTWNAQEHSWDCSCHGSRFSACGEVIDNPATADLKSAPKKQKKPTPHTPSDPA